MILGGHTLAIVNGSFKGVIKLTSYFRRSAYASTAVLSLLVLATLCPIYLVSDVSEAATHDATPATLTFASIRNTASVSFNVSSTAGTFATSESNETASFSLSTNNATGYTLTLRTSDSTTSLSYGANSISTINGSKLSSEFAANTWGLLPSKYNSTANTTNYYPASNAGFTIEETNTANSSNGIDNPNTYTIGLGIKADFTVPAGTYTNTTIVAEYVANPVTYAIYYYSNTTDTVTGMPSPNPQVPASAFPGTTSTTTSLASTPTRTGYTFLGWCLGTSSSSNITVGTNGNADTCASSSTNQFTAGQSFGINATGSSPDLYYFYAMWQAIIYTVTINNTNTTTSTNSLSIFYGSSATVTVTPASGYYLSSVSCPSGVSCTGYGTGESYTGAQTVTITNNTATTSSGTLSFVAEEPKTYMQDMTLVDCPTSGAKVYDKRDESSYTVKKLADGYCWMTQNLALDLTALTQAQLYGTGTNAGKLTNASNTTLDYLKNGGGTTSDKYPTAKLNNVAWTSTSQNYYSIPMMVSSGTCNNAYCANSNLSWSYTDTLAATINGTTSRVQGKIGIYYNYCAASAGSYCYGNGTSAGTSSGNASEDICPYGWHLPAGDTAQGSFDYLYNTGYSASYNNFVDALSTPLSGVFYNSGKAYSQGSNGSFWSSTRNNNGRMYRLYVDSSSVYPQNYTYRYAGLSVRCVKDSDGYMQDFALANATDGLEYTLKDKRDDKTYTVKKINDALWMTQNLRYLGDTGSSAGTMTIGNNNTNAANTSITLYSLDSSNAGNFGAYANHCDATNSYNYACVYDSSSTTTGVWYNYNAATAGTISTDNNSTTASNSICPAGWRIPSFDTSKPAGSINSISLASQIAPFNPSGGGRYNNGSLNYTDYGFWWTDTARNATERRLMSYDGSSPAIESYNRRYGLFVRCVRST